MKLVSKLLSCMLSTIMFHPIWIFHIGQFCRASGLHLIEYRMHHLVIGTWLTSWVCCQQILEQIFVMFTYLATRLNPAHALLFRRVQIVVLFDWCFAFYPYKRLDQVRLGKFLHFPKYIQNLSNIQYVLIVKLKGTYLIWDEGIQNRKKVTSSE